MLLSEVARRFRQRQCYSCVQASSSLSKTKVIGAVATTDAEQI